MLPSAIGVVLSRRPDADMEQNLPLEDMTHEPLAFLSGTYKGSQMRWATIDNDGFAIVSTFRRLEHFLWNEVHIFADHRNHAYIFGLGAASGGLERCSWPVSEHHLSHPG